MYSTKCSFDKLMANPAESQDEQFMNEYPCIPVIIATFMFLCLILMCCRFAKGKIKGGTNLKKKTAKATVLKTWKTKSNKQKTQHQKGGLCNEGQGGKRETKGGGNNRNTEKPKGGKKKPS